MRPASAMLTSISVHGNPSISGCTCEEARDSGERKRLRPVDARPPERWTSASHSDQHEADPTALNAAATSARTGPEDRSGSRRFSVNVLSSVGFITLNVGLMAWYVPFLVSNLGLAAYGMLALANSLVLYLAIVTDSLNGSVFRYLGIDLNQGDLASANRTFNSALILSVLASCLLLVPIAATCYLLPLIFQVPPELIAATRFVLAAVGVTALAALVGGVFGVSSLVRHRFDLRNIVRSLVALCRIGVVVLLFAAEPPSLVHVGIGFIVAAAIGLAGDVLLWRKLTPELSINPRLIESARFRPLIGLGAWSAINVIGVLFIMQVDVIIVNQLLGPEATGRYASILLFPVLIYTMGEAVLPVLSPAIMAHYATGNKQALQELAKRSVRLLAVWLALPIGLLCGMGAPLLAFWLGPAFADLETSYVLTAYNEVKAQGLVTLALGAANVVLAIAFVRAGLGLAGVPAAAALVWTMRNVLFVSSRSAVLLGLRWYAFNGHLAIGLLGMAGVAALGRILCALWWPTGWLSLASFAAVITLAYGAFAYFVFMTKADRELVSSVFARRSPS
jgi:membrane protein EpsK